jgi:hypothetical protein
MDPEKAKQSSGAWKIVLIIGLVLVFLIGAYFGLAWILRVANGDSSSSSGISLGGSKLSDQALVGTWESECLVPDPGSKWAEKHKYVIKSDGTAVHTRQDWASTDCTTTEPSGTITDNLKLTIPSSGKINMTFTSSENSRMDSAQSSQYTGQTLYDIYKVSGSTLEFGWGFRGDNLAYGGKTGSSDADRFDTLNSFIVYNKK